MGTLIFSPDQSTLSLFWPLISLLSVLAFGLFLLLIGFSGLLRRTRFLRVGILNFEVGNDQQVYNTTIGGVCPRCGSAVRLATVGPKDNRTDMLLCQRNPTQHRWTFDPTMLPEIDDEVAA